MSSWRKASKTNQKTHRERHQPEARKHLGILEKKKDYKRRADDQQEKQETLKLLRKRALNKNPDEFYHHMINSKINEGQHHELEKDDNHTTDQIKLMQTQDIKYISMKRTIEANKIKRLQAELHMTDMANHIANKHVFYVEADEDVKNFDVAKRLDTHPALLGRRTNRPKLDDINKLASKVGNESDVLTMQKLREQKYKELLKRIEREKELKVIMEKMELKRKLQEKRLQEPKRIKKGTKNSAPVYEFKFERKK